MKYDLHEIKMINLRCHRPKEGAVGKFQLFDNRLEYYVFMVAEEPVIDGDPESGWHDSPTDLEIIVRRDMVVACQLSHHETSDVYGICIIALETNPIYLYFKTKKEARPLYNEIKEWIFGK